VSQARRASKGGPGSATSRAVDASRRRLVRTINRRLTKAFGPLEPPRREDPLDELILTVLSQHTSDVNSLRAFEALRARFPAWNAVVLARDRAVADAIRVGGLANVKAPRIKSILREIREREGGFDLSWMSDAPDAEVRDYLRSLPGVGPKTAAVVLAFSLGRDVLPVDTHVHRVAGRLGLVPAKASAERANDLLDELVPAGLRIELHVGLIRLGREICKAPRPRCATCPLADLCPTAPKVLGASAAQVSSLRRRRTRTPSSSAGRAPREPRAGR
jgi:endonuclease-3